MEDTTGENRPDPEEEYGGPVKPFLDHLEDLRWVLIKSISALVLGMGICALYAPWIKKVLTGPFDALGEPLKLQVFDVMGGFSILLKIAFWGGLLLAFPFIGYFVGSFVIPALKGKEKKYFFIGLCIGAGLFVIGVLFSYFFVLKVSLRAFLMCSRWMGFDMDWWRAESYFLFAIQLLLGVGVSFELPVVVLTLVRIGILDHKTLVKGRPYMLVINFAASAFITPPDVLSTIVLTLPMQLLFEICIWVSAYWERNEKNRLAAEGLEPVS